MKKFKLIETKRIVGRGNILVVEYVSTLFFDIEDILGQEIILVKSDGVYVERVKMIEYGDTTKVIDKGDTIGIKIYEN